MNSAEFYIEREYVRGTWVSAELLFCNGCRRRIRDNQKTVNRHTPTKLICQKSKETMPIVSKSDKNDTRILSPNTSVGELFLYNSKSLKTISVEETRHLLQNIENKKKSGHDSSDDVNKLVEANMGFIIALAREYYIRAFDKFDANNDYFAELVSIGTIAMNKRLSKRPEPNFEGSVVDRVNYSMNNELMRFAIQEQWGKFSAIPVDYANRYSRYLKCKNKLSIELKREPTKTEIVGAMIDEKNCTALQALRTIERIAPLAESCLYMATKMYFDDGSNVEFQDTLESDTPSPEQLAIDRERYAQLIQAVGKLPEREQTIINLRYGLKDNVFRTLEEVGGELNLTRERIRQIEAVALRKLRHPGFARGLRQ